MNKIRLYMGDYFALYIGALPHIPEHRHTTGAICVSLGDFITLSDDYHSNPLITRSAFIPQNLSTQISFGKQPVLLVCFEVESLYSQILFETYDFPLDRITADLAVETELLTAAEKLLESPSITTENVEAINNLLVPISATLNTGVDLDPRIASLSLNIQMNLETNLDIESMAMSVDLSPSRLSHLFRAQTGLSIRRFRLWKRMQNVLKLYLEGATLTDAAIHSGFTDSAHFSNTCKKLLGITPSLLLNNKIPIEITVP